MSLNFAVPREDVERYERFRKRSREFNQQILKNLPRAAMEATARALGIFHQGKLLLDTEDVICVLMDCCLHDWVENGKTLVEKYAEAYPQTPGSDEELLLRAYRQARFRILVLEHSLPGAGFFCQDTLANEPLFLMDIALSHSLHGQIGILASRTIPFRNYWITTGAGLPIDQNSGETILRKLQKEKLLEDPSPAGAHRLALTVLRTCLDHGAAEYVRYAVDDEGETDSTRPRIGTRPSAHVVGRNDPCPCGSGMKYKRCCLGK